MSDNTNNTNNTGDTPVLLCTRADDVITDMLVAALKDNQIPAMKKTHGFTGQSLSVVMGYSHKNADIYVPSRLLDEAREIYNLIIAADESEEDETEETKEYEEE